jgi:O-antigen ligase
MLKSRLIGVETILLTILLYTIGTLSSVIRGGVVTPNIALLLLFLLIVSANLDLSQNIIKLIALSSHVLVSLSALVILLKLNPLGLYFNSKGYPVYLDAIGIPGRNYGIFAHPNILGQASCICMLFMLGTKVNKIYLVLPLFCLIKCGSRTAIIGAVVGIIVYAVISFFGSRKISNKLRKIEYPLVIGTFIMAILLATTVQFFQYINLIDPNALTSRGRIWQDSLSLFQDSSFFGLGWDWEKRAINSQLLSIWATSAHNVILEIAFSAGIAGLLILLFFLAKSLAYITNLTLLEKILLLSIIISGVSESYIDLQYPTFQTYLFFYIVLGANREHGRLA